MDWNLTVHIVAVTLTLISIVGGLFTFIRKIDQKSIDGRIKDLTTRMTAQESLLAEKLNEAEFRRFEARIEVSLKDVQANTNSGLEKLETKLDEKFDKLFNLLLTKK